MNETGAKKKAMVAPEVVEDKLLKLLDTDIARANKRYHRLFQKLVILFAARRCADPENLAGETITRAYYALSTGVNISVQLENFVFGVAKKILLEDYRRQRKAPVPFDELPAERHPHVDPLNDILDVPKWQQDLSHRCCEKCLQKLDVKQRTQLILYYQGDAEGEMKRNRKQLAAKLGIRPRALSSRMLRLREKLELCITACIDRRQRS